MQLLSIPLLKYNKMVSQMIISGAIWGTVQLGVNLLGQNMNELVSSPLALEAAEMVSQTVTQMAIELINISV